MVSTNSIRTYANRQTLKPVFTELAVGRNSLFAQRLAASELELAGGFAREGRVRVVRINGNGPAPAMQEGAESRQLLAMGRSQSIEGAFVYKSSGAQRHSGAEPMDVHVLMLPEGSGRVSYKFGRNGRLLGAYDESAAEAGTVEQRMSSGIVVVKETRKTREPQAARANAPELMKLESGASIEEVLQGIAGNAKGVGKQVVGYIAGFLYDIHLEPLSAAGSLPANPKIANGQEMPAIVTFSFSQEGGNASILGVHNPTRRCGIPAKPYGGELKAANVGNGAYAVYSVV